MPNQYTHKQTQLLVRIHALCNPCNKALQFRVSAELQKNIPTDHTASSVCKDFFVSAKKNTAIDIAITWPFSLATTYLVYDVVFTIFFCVFYISTAYPQIPIYSISF